MLFLNLFICLFVGGYFLARGKGRIKVPLVSLLWFIYFYFLIKYKRVVSLILLGHQFYAS